MRVGKPGEAATAICEAHADRIEVRGRDLTRDIVGHLSFTGYFHLLLTGRDATPQQLFFLDALLTTIAEHGLVPTVQAARMTLAAEPDALQGAVAAGLLGAGKVLLGTSELCGSLLVEADGRVRAGAAPDAVAAALVAELRASGATLPGFGHPVHKTADPRTVRLFALADERGVSGRHIAMARAIEQAVARARGKPLVMNVSMAIAAVMLDLDFAETAIKAVPILARTASLLAHLAEERERPIGFILSEHAEAAISYRRGGLDRS